MSSQNATKPNSCESIQVDTGEMKTDPLNILYKQSLKADRGGALFSAFSYPTKISPETIALFIASHTQPGDTVFDGFGGSGTTGLATLLCGRPSNELVKRAEKLGLPVNWGPRQAILSEVGVLGSFIARTLCKPPDPKLFRKAAEKLLKKAESQYKWMYQAWDLNGKQGYIRHIVWTDILKCPICQQTITVWNACVQRNPARISSCYTCVGCEEEIQIDTASRVTNLVDDDLLEQKRRTRTRKPAWIYGITGKNTWTRKIESSDLELIKRIENEKLPDSIPIEEIQWGDLYRSGYHKGITHLHHFYTRRNLIIFAKLWREVSKFPESLHDALRLWLLSYNAAHSTIMTRVVAKKQQKDLVVTGSQPGVLYISGLPVEKNILRGLKRKLNTFVKAFEITCESPGSVEVINKSCLSVNLPDNSIDYIFTDPPFGGNIPYAEINFINEAWLGKITDMYDEITVSKHQNKDIQDYEMLLEKAFTEAYRLLKDDGKITVIFHSATAEIWNALRNAYEKAGFKIDMTSVLDKTQGSFKQVTTTGAVCGDPVLLLRKGKQHENNNEISLCNAVNEVIQKAKDTDNPNELTPRRLYSRFITYLLHRNQAVPIDAERFYQLLNERTTICGGRAVGE